MVQLYEDEEYRFLVGINEDYAITNYGRVLSFCFCKNHKDSTEYCTEVKPRPGKNLYHRVYIRDKRINKRKDFYVHRLVAMYFLDKEEGKDLVNHKDHNRQNNKVSNLEWSTYKENNKDTLKFGATIRLENGRFASGLK